MHPFDIPDEAHPPVSVPELETPSETLPPEWINAEALSAAVGHASAWMARGSDPWHTDDVLNVARVYREFITGETS